MFWNLNIFKPFLLLINRNVHAFYFNLKRRVKSTCYFFCNTFASHCFLRVHAEFPILTWQAKSVYTINLHRAYNLVYNVYLYSVFSYFWLTSCRGLIQNVENTKACRERHAKLQVPSCTAAMVMAMVPLSNVSSRFLIWLLICHVSKCTAFCDGYLNCLAFSIPRQCK